MLNIAHRGFRSRYPENTLLAFRKAVEAGCHGIEFDVHLSQDGEAVIIHDETLERTTDGTGLVAEKSLRELKTLNAAKPHPETAEFEAIPTLREYFDYISTQPEIISNIELKTGVFVYDGIEEIVYRMMKEYDLVDRCIVSSFNHESILRMKKIDSAVPCGQGSYPFDKRFVSFHTIGGDVKYPVGYFIEKRKGGLINSIKPPSCIGLYQKRRLDVNTAV